MDEYIKDLISQSEAARLRGVTREAISGLIERGSLRSVEVGGRKLVYKSEVLAFEKNPPGPAKGTKKSKATKKGQKS